MRVLSLRFCVVWFLALPGLVMAVAADAVCLWQNVAGLSQTEQPANQVARAKRAHVEQPSSHHELPVSGVLADVEDDDPEDHHGLLITASTAVAAPAFAAGCVSGDQSVCVSYTLYTLPERPPRA